MGQIYLSLIKTGNVLFKNWTSTIYCQEDTPYTMKINFGIERENQNIFANRESEKNTLSSINKTIKFLNDSYKEWLEHVNLKRNLFPCLNFFQIDQIVMLRASLANLIHKIQTGVSNIDPDQYKSVFDLLYNINNSLSLGQLIEANRHAYESEHELNLAPVEADTNDQREKELIEELTDLGFSKSLIRKAIKELNTYDSEKLTTYCMMQDMEEEESLPPPRKTPKLLQDFSQIKSEMILETHDAYEDDQENDLTSKYKNLWTRFATFLDLNFEEFISLNHLGLMLNYLKSSSTSVVNRVKPLYLEFGKLIEIEKCFFIKILMLVNK